MNFWWMVFWAGLGTYLMRTAGVWISPRWLQGNWLNQLPFAVILVMAVGSVASLMTAAPADVRQIIATLLASGAVIVTTLGKLPLVVCIAAGCLVFGILALSTP